MFEIWDWTSHYAVAFWDALSLVTEYGGWRNRQLIEFFVRFAETVFKRYKNKVKYWMTFNEINNQANYTEDFAPFTNFQVLNLLTVKIENPLCIRLLTMSLWQVRKLSKLVMTSILEFQIGSMIAMCPIYPASMNPRRDTKKAQVAMHAVTGLVMYMRAVIIRATWRLTSSVVVLPF